METEGKAAFLAAYAEETREAKPEATAAGTDSVHNETVNRNERSMEEPQPWLDYSRERAYEALNRSWGEVFQDKAYLGKWLEAYANQFAEVLGNEKITAADVSEAVFMKVSSENASAVAGQKIVRPMFVFKDFAQYQKFATAIQGEAGLSSRGMNVTGKILADEFANTSTIFATNNQEFADHEIMHSIDPHVLTRTGYDNLLSEMLAYYGKEIIESNPKGWQHLQNPADGPWKGLAGSAGGLSYYESYSQTADSPLSQQDWIELSNQAAAALRTYAEKHGHIEAQRLLARSADLPSFFQAAGAEMPAFEHEASQEAAVSADAHQSASPDPSVRSGNNVGELVVTKREAPPTATDAPQSLVSIPSETGQGVASIAESSNHTSEQPALTESQPNGSSETLEKFIEQVQNEVSQLVYTRRESSNLGFQAVYGGEFLAKTYGAESYVAAAREMLEDENRAELSIPALIRKLEPDPAKRAALFDQMEQFSDQEATKRENNIAVGVDVPTNHPFVIDANHARLLHHVMPGLRSLDKLASGGLQALAYRASKLLFDTPLNHSEQAFDYAVPERYSGELIESLKQVDNSLVELVSRRTSEYDQQAVVLREKLRVSIDQLHEALQQREQELEQVAREKGDTYAAQLIDSVRQQIELTGAFAGHELSANELDPLMQEAELRAQTYRDAVKSAVEVELAPLRKQLSRLRGLEQSI